MHTRRWMWRVLGIGVLVLWVWAAAVQAVPRTTADARRVRAQEALSWMRGQQQADGSFGSAWGVTADAVYVIGLYVRTYGDVREDPGGPRWTRNGRSALDALADMAANVVQSGDAGYIAKVLRAVAVNGRNPRAFGGVDLVAALWNTYDAASGRFHAGNNFRQALALQALHLAGEPVPARAVQSLLDDQRPNGGWGWPYRGTSVDVDTTGLVLETLGLLGVSASDPHVRAAVAYLQRVQNEDGAWGMDAGQVSNANSTALALRGLLAVGENVRQPPYTGPLPDGRWKDAFAALLRFQAPDGGFRWTERWAGTRMLATTDALPALLTSWPGDRPLNRRVHLAYVP